jgi:hypothetical protein
MTEFQIVILIAYACFVAFDSLITRRSGGNWLAVFVGALALILILAFAIWSNSLLGRILPVVIYGAIVLGRDRWVAIIGCRPEVGLFTAYRRYYIARQTERTSVNDALREVAHRQVVDELQGLDRWRSRNTTRLVDLLRDHYALLIDPESSSEERQRVAVDLDGEMIRVWGPPEGRGIRI